jgi:hypothetical protein
MSEESRKARVKEVRADLREDWHKQEQFLFDTYQAFDKTIISIISAVLVLSLTLLKDAVNTHECLCYLIVAIVLFFLSLASVLSSYAFGVRAYKKHMENISLVHADLSLNGKLSLGKLPDITEVCNVLSAVFLFLGGISIFAFFINKI